jgi:hypothetical protein
VAHSYGESRSQYFGTFGETGVPGTDGTKPPLLKEMRCGLP